MPGALLSGHPMILYYTVHVKRVQHGSAQRTLLFDGCAFCIAGSVCHDACAASGGIVWTFTNPLVYCSDTDLGSTDVVTKSICAGVCVNGKPEQSSSVWLQPQCVPCQGHLQGLTERVAPVMGT